MVGGPGGWGGGVSERNLVVKLVAVGCEVMAVAAVTLVY